MDGTVATVAMVMCEGTTRSACSASRHRRVELRMRAIRRALGRGRGSRGSTELAQTHGRRRSVPLALVRARVVDDRAGGAGGRVEVAVRGVRAERVLAVRMPAYGARP